MNNYWISWYGKTREAFELYSPWWVSGWSFNDLEEIPMFCAAIKATSEQDAKKKILNSHDNKELDLEFRFCCLEDSDWSPFCERFPRGEWMQWSNE